VTTAEHAAPAAGDLVHIKTKKHRFVRGRSFGTQSTTREASCGGIEMADSHR
jgi:hypothetical protein